MPPYAGEVYPGADGTERGVVSVVDATWGNRGARMHDRGPNTTLVPDADSRLTPRSPRQRPATDAFPVGRASSRPDSGWERAIITPLPDQNGSVGNHAFQRPLHRPSLPGSFFPLPSLRVLAL